jgi:GNAT superfamily N-acetyltransferase
MEINMFDKIAVPDGAIDLRPARPEDADFLFELFRAHSTGVLKLGRLPDQKIDELLTTQYASRLRSFRERFPHARWSVVEFAGTPIGELIVDEDANTICIVDIALRPEYQRRGIGGALLRALAAAAGQGGLRAMVMMTNAASLSMFRRLGFAETGHDSAYIELRWRP